MNIVEFTCSVKLPPLIPMALLSLTSPVLMHHPLAFAHSLPLSLETVKLKVE